MRIKGEGSIVDILLDSLRMRRQESGGSVKRRESELNVCLPEEKETELDKGSGSGESHQGVLCDGCHADLDWRILCDRSLISWQ